MCVFFFQGACLAGGGGGGGGGKRKELMENEMLSNSHGVLCMFRFSTLISEMPNFVLCTGTPKSNHIFEETPIKKTNAIQTDAQQKENNPLMAKFRIETNHLPLFHSGLRQRILLLGGVISLSGSVVSIIAKWQSANIAERAPKKGITSIYVLLEMPSVNWQLASFVSPKGPFCQVPYVSVIRACVFSRVPFQVD